MGHLRPRVVTARDASRQPTRASSAATPGEDAYLAKLVKYVPAEAIATYQTAVNFIPEEEVLWVFGVSLAILVLTPAWVWLATTDKNEEPAYFQIAVSPLAFVVWLIALHSPSVAYALGAPLERFVAGLALLFATAVIPLLEKVFVKKAE